MIIATRFPIEQRITMQPTDVIRQATTTSTSAATSFGSQQGELQSVSFERIGNETTIDPADLLLFPHRRMVQCVFELDPSDLITPFPFNDR
jgi:hypothetical protein